MPPPGTRFFQSPLLQPALHKLFVPRPPPDYIPPTDMHLDGYKGPRINDVASYIEPFKTSASSASNKAALSAEERKRLKREETKQKGQAIIEAGLPNWNPKENPSATADPLKTLFVGRLVNISSCRSSILIFLIAL